MLLHFVLVLHFAAIVVTFCVSITFCGDYYILRRNNHQQFMQMFWRQWRNECLTSLRENHWTRRASCNQKIKVADVVLIHDDTSRNQWRLGSIIKIHRAKDDLIRAVSLRVSNGRELSRPIEKLYLLEIHSDEKEELTEQTSLNKEHEICLDKQTRPKRAAAQVAAQKIKKLSY